jgi:hypothetical protein
LWLWWWWRRRRRLHGRVNHAEASAADDGVHGKRVAE